MTDQRGYNSDNSETVTAAGVRFHLQRRGQPAGSEPPAVLVHGFGSDLYSWDLLWSQLTRPALRYDLRGFGHSRVLPPASDDTPFSHTDDLLALLDQLQIERCDLVGVSMGGAIALNFALDHPGRVRRLSLISPALVAWEWSDAWRQRWRPIVEQARAGRMDKARQLWWQHPLFATTREGPAAARLRDGIDRFAGRQWLHDAQRPHLPDLERLHQLQLPTLLLSGGCDFEDFQLIAELLQASVPQLTRHHLPAAGHCLQLEVPDFCARQINTFLNPDS